MMSPHFLGISTADGDVEAGGLSFQIDQRPIARDSRPIETRLRLQEGLSGS